MTTPSYTPFRAFILKAMQSTSTDEELKKELHKLLNEDLGSKAYLVRPIKKVEKTIH